MSKTIIITLAVVAAILSKNAVNAQRSQIPAQRPQLPEQQNLAQLFFSSRLTQQDPQKSMDCFSAYIAQSNLISNDYSVAYNSCLHNTKEEHKYINEKTLSTRYYIQNSAEDICRQLKKCNGENQTLEMFQCHAFAGANITTAVWDLSSNAERQASDLQEDYRKIALKEDNCLRTAERIYVSDSGVAYKHLQTCLDGRAEPQPGTTTTSTTPTITDSTTTEVETTESTLAERY